MPAAKQQKVYTREEVAKHSTESDLWVIVGSKVFDITRFLKRHPGGTAPLRYAGGDATKVFNGIHPLGTLDTVGGKFEVGSLNPAEQLKTEEDDDAVAAAASGSSYNVADDPDHYDDRIGGEYEREFGDHMVSPRSEFLVVRA